MAWIPPGNLGGPEALLFRLCFGKVLEKYFVLNYTATLFTVVKLY